MYRLQYISGFTGSNGSALITQEHALLWTDSRYWLQAEKELNLKPDNSFVMINTKAKERYSFPFIIFRAKKNGVEQQDEKWTLIKQGDPDHPTMLKWIKANLKDGDVVGTFIHKPIF